MSGFAAWEQGPYGTITLGLLMLALGVIIGLDVGRRWGRRRVLADLRARREATRAAAWWRQIRAAETIDLPPVIPASSSYGLWQIHDPEAGERREAMARRTHPVYRVPPPLIVSEDPASLAYWRSLDRPAEPETDEEFSARLAAAADEIIAWAHAAAGGDDQ